MAQLLGETARAMDSGEAKTIEKILDDERFRKRNSYYIFKTSQWEGNGNVLRSKYTMRTKKPLLPLLKSKLWLVDNRRGCISLIWDLPAQYVGDERFASKEDKDICRQVFDSSKLIAPMGAIQ